jgi:GNAT superfamily N-acetyltransferase
MGSLAKIGLVASPGHLPELAATRIKNLDDQLFPGIGLELDGRWWWLAVEGDWLAGYAGLAPAGYANRGYLCRAGVARQFRGCGMHHRLIRVREQHARRLGMPRLITYTQAENHASSNNLISAGYKLYTPESDYAGPGGNWLYWYKDL